MITIFHSVCTVTIDERPIVGQLSRMSTCKQWNDFGLLQGRSLQGIRSHHCVPYFSFSSQPLGCVSMNFLHSPVMANMFWSVRCVWIVFNGPFPLMLSPDSVASSLLHFFFCVSRPSFFTRPLFVSCFSTQKHAVYQFFWSVDAIAVNKVQRSGVSVWPTPAMDGCKFNLIVILLKMREVVVQRVIGRRASVTWEWG